MPLFAIASTNVDQLADSLEVALNVCLDHRDSTYWGTYRLFRRAERELRVYPNSDPMYQKADDPAEDEFFEPTFRDYGVLVGVFGETSFIEAVQHALTAVGTGAALIRD